MIPLNEENRLLHYDRFEQVVVLTDQGSPEGMKDRSE